MEWHPDERMNLSTRGHNGLQPWTNPFRPCPVFKRVAVFSNPWWPEYAGKSSMQASKDYKPHA